MLQWLRSLLNFFGGGLQYLWNAIINVIQSVYSDLNGNLVSLWRYADALDAAIWHLAGYINSFIVNDYGHFVTWVVREFAAFSARADQEYNQLIGYINDLAHRTQQNITVVQEGLNSSIAALIRWIIQNIFDPLFNDITGLLNWLSRWGNWLVDILTHLEKLADLLMAFLWSGWLLLFRKYAKQIVIFIFQHWKSWIPDVLSVIEDIIASVFLPDRWHDGRQLATWHKARATPGVLYSPGDCSCSH